MSEGTERVNDIQGHKFTLISIYWHGILLNRMSPSELGTLAQQRGWNVRREKMLLDWVCEN